MINEQSASDVSQSTDGLETTGLVSQVSSAEMDKRVALAHKHPRSIVAFKREALQLATMNEEAADECIYALPRAGKTIEGPSIRFAEILFYCWRNIDAGTRIIDEQRDFIVAQGVVRDLERNTSLTREVSRRIRDKNGNRYNRDMIQQTAAAASSIAVRNAIHSAIPRALWWDIYLEVRKVVTGDATTFKVKLHETLNGLQKVHVTAEMVLAKYGYKGIDDITMDNVVELRGIRNAIRDGHVSVEEAMKPALEEGELSETTPQTREQQAQEALKKRQQADSAAKQDASAAAAPAGRDPSTTVDAGKGAAEAPKQTKEEPAAKKNGGKKAAAAGASADLVGWTEETAIELLKKSKSVAAIDEAYDQIAENMKLTEKLSSIYTDLRNALKDQI